MLDASSLDKISVPLHQTPCNRIVSTTVSIRSTGGSQVKCSWLPIEIDMCCCQEHHAVQFGQIGRLENNPRYDLSNGELRNELSVMTGSSVSVD